MFLQGVVRAKHTGSRWRWDAPTTWGQAKEELGWRGIALEELDDGDAGVTSGRAGLHQHVVYGDGYAWESGWGKGTT